MSFSFPFSGNFYGQALSGIMTLYNDFLQFPVILSHLPGFCHLFTNSYVIPLSNIEISKGKKVLFYMGKA